jgi:hypothetical protein
MAPEIENIINSITGNNIPADRVFGKTTNI